MRAYDGGWRSESHKMEVQTRDVFVVGGGPVGLAAAIAARRKGFSVTLADSRQPPLDKTCGEGLMPDGVEASTRLGLNLQAVENFQVKGIRFAGESVAVQADFPRGPGLGVRRTTLHNALTMQAEREGVELLWRHQVGSLDSIKAGWIVGADGTASQVRQWAGLNASKSDSRRYGFRLHYQRAPWTDYIEIHWGDGCQIYITPVAPNEVSVALISRNPKLRVREAMRQFPELAGRFADAAESSIESGGVTASRSLRRVRRGNVALIGDASGSVDAITGEGLCLGFQQALALADAMECGDLARYESAHRRLARRPRFMANLMLTMDRSRWVRKRALPALASHPDLFAGLLAMHVGAAQPGDFAANCAALGWRIIST
jgi:menaquinone-9 beta-reductase